MAVLVSGQRQVLGEVIAQYLEFSGWSKKTCHCGFQGVFSENAQFAKKGALSIGDLSIPNPWRLD